MTTRATATATATATAMAVGALTAAALLAPHDPASPPSTSLAGLRPAHSPGTVTDDANPPAGTCAYRPTPAGLLPDPACTPGGYDPAITQATLATTVCLPGWTRAVRPPARETDAYKARALLAYNTTAYGPAAEYDHLVPLALGGSNATSNLWPQPGPVPNPKDTVERRLLTAVCAGRVSLDAARAAIARDWTTADRVVPR